MNRSKNIIYLFVLFAVFSCDTSSSVEPRYSDYFLKYHGSAGDQIAAEFKQTLDGGFIIVGTSKSIEGGEEILLIKTDQLGNEEWNSTFVKGIEYKNEGIAVEILSDGSGYLVAGNSTAVINDADKDVLLIKVDNDGNELDREVLGDLNHVEEVSDILILNNGDIMLAGSSSNTTKFFKNSNPSDDTYDFYFPKVDINLDPITSWTGYWGFEGEDKAVSISQNNIGDFVIFGTSDRSETSDPSLDNNNFFVRTLLASEIFGDGGVTTGTTDNQLASNMSMTSVGGQLLVGTSESSNGSNIFISRINSDNKKASSFELLKVEATTGKAIVEAIGGGYLILGSITRNANSDVYLLKTNNSGAVIWEQIFGGSNDDLPGDLIQLEDGSIVFTCTVMLDNQQKIGLIKTNEKGNLYN